MKEEKNVLIEDLTNEQLNAIAMRGEVLATIRVYYNWRFGCCGEYKAIVKPQFFKNGKMKKSGFEVVKKLETVKKWYMYDTAREYHTLYSVEVYE